MKHHIREITDDEIKAMARDAAEHGTPLEDANYFTPLSEGWMAFNLAYRNREAELRNLQRQVEEVA